MNGNPSGWEGLGATSTPSRNILSAWHHTKGGCKISHHHGPDTPSALPVPAHPSLFSPPCHRPGLHFIPQGCQPLPLQHPSRASLHAWPWHAPNSVHASREVTEAWGWGCPKGSQLSCFWPCCWDMHFKRKQLPENS